MLSKYFGEALAEASIHLPDVEVRDLTFLADPKSCGWINKDDFIKVMVRPLSTRKLAKMRPCAPILVLPTPN